MDSGEMSQEGVVGTGQLFDLFMWQTYAWEHRGVLVPLNGQFAQCDQCGMTCLSSESETHKCPEVANS